MSNKNNKKSLANKAFIVALNITLTAVLTILCAKLPKILMKLSERGK